MISFSSQSLSVSAALHRMPGFFLKAIWVLLIRFNFIVFSTEKAIRFELEHFFRAEVIGEINKKLIQVPLGA